MTKECHSSYKGWAITARSDDAPGSSGSAERASLASISGRFVASFSVENEDARIDAWQQFPPACFSTRVRAVANAVTEAQKSIDTRLKLAHGLSKRN